MRRPAALRPIRTASLDEEPAQGGEVIKRGQRRGPADHQRPGPAVFRSTSCSTRRSVAVRSPLCSIREFVKRTSEPRHTENGKFASVPRIRSSQSEISRAIMRISDFGTLDHAPFRLSQRRTSRRGGRPCRPRRSGRHAVLLLFDRDSWSGTTGCSPTLSPTCRRWSATRSRPIPTRRVIATLARLGAGADVVSGGELKRALAAGIPPKKIMFSGIGKTAAELALAVDEDILCVNVESEPELELLSQIAAGKGRTVDISIRVNPDVDAKTHAKIATGKSENKFGIPISRAREVYRHAAQLAGHPCRRRRHAYRQPDHRTCRRLRTPSRCCRISCMNLRADGHTISHVDLGGGLGIPYREGDESPPDPAAYAKVVKRGDARSRLQADFRARAPDRRQCRHPA